MFNGGIDDDKSDKVDVRGCGIRGDVVIPKAAAAYTVTVSTAFKIGSLTVGGGAEAAAPTINFDNGLTTNEVTGSVYVYSGSLTHSVH